MFYLAIAIGIYSYLMFFIGLLGFLYKNVVLIISALYLIFWFFLLREKITKIKFKAEYKNIFTILIVVQVLINLMGVFGPEISFDSLWYHLTLPKLYLINHKVFFIPGNLLYYSAMPKLVEMLYVVGLSLGGEVYPKLIHFVFGILSVYVVYKIARNYLPYKFSLIASVIFYSNLVVGWESITSYIDLARTFFELLSILALLKWTQRNQFKYLLFSSLMIGFSITSKLLSVVSLFIIGIFIILFSFLRKKSFKNILTHFLIYILIAFIIPFPWFIFSFINTGNPFYPIGNFILNSKIPIFAFTKALEDPISPLYLIIIPIMIVNFNKFSKKINLLLFYSISGFLLWLVFVRVAGARYLLPYLAVFSVVTSCTLFTVKNKFIYRFLIVLIIFISLFSIIYREIANAKFVPVIIGFEKKSDFLSRNLNFSFGDFYDLDGYFKNNIKPSDSVLLIGFHNLFYVDFPFVDYSWLKKGASFNYIAVQNSPLPSRFSNWNKVYYNSKTKVALYSLKGKK